MKRKTQLLKDFIKKLHDFIVTNRKYRKDLPSKSEAFIQAEIRPLITEHLEKYFQGAGYKDYIKRAHDSFYWERQEGRYDNKRGITFASRNYPDFVVTLPYLLAIEYKKGSSGSLVKSAIGQSIMHALSEEFDYAYVLFYDENKDKRITKSVHKKSKF